MWLIPDCISSMCARELAGLASDLRLRSPEPELWVTSSGTPTPRGFSWRGWKTRPWHRRLFGAAISERSTGDRIVGAWISSVGASRALRGATPADGLARLMRGIYGTHFDALGRRRFERPSSSSRMFQGLLPGMDSLVSEMSYADWVTELKRDYSVRERWARRCYGNGCLSWPSPRASAGEARTTGRAPSHGVTHGESLAGTAADWPTPMAHDVHPGDPERIGRFGTKAGGRNLTDEATDWPTPTANDGKGSAQVKQQRYQLDEAAEQLWQTPGTDSFRSRGVERRDEMGLDQQARTWAPWAGPMAMDGMKPSAGNRRLQDLGHQAGAMVLHGTTSSRGGRGLPLLYRILRVTSLARLKRVRRLNPAFAEWLLGWPVGWSASDALATGLTRLWRQRLSWSLRRVLAAEMEMEGWGDDSVES